VTGRAFRAAAVARRVARRLRATPPPAPLHLAVPWPLLELRREGPAPLAAPSPAARRGGPLRVAAVVPPFRRGSGGHGTIAHLLRGVEARGHACTVYVEDDEGRHAGQGDAELGDLWRAFFGPLAGPVRGGLDGWQGADVALATGWQTVPRVLRLPGAAARAYLVQDHEPEFYGTSAERLWAEATYREDLHVIAASPWLAGLLRERYGASASTFDLGVDHAHYAPRPQATRRPARVLVYARAVTPRRAVPLALLAAAELHRRRPDVELALFGESRPLPTPFPATHLGVLGHDALAQAYAEATAGLVLSPTNPSLVPLEMLACGLPCVDLASDSMRATFGPDGPLLLAEPDPLALAGALERLLSDPQEREARAQAGLALARTRTWERAAAQVEEGLREALARTAGG